MTTLPPTRRSPWLWVPTLYLAEGFPYFAVLTVATIMYKRLDVSNAEIAFYTSLLSLPWALKPLWSPFIDMFKTKRFWTVTLQFIIGAALAGVAACIPLPLFFPATLLLFACVAFASATHDIAADGFYMLGLDQRQQAAFVGVRNTFYRFAWIAASGGLVMLAGYLEMHTSSIAVGWSLTYAVIAVAMVLFSFYHRFALPVPATDTPTLDRGGASNVLREFVGTFAEFFKKEHIVTTLLYILFYRFAESQLVKIAQLFMLDPQNKGGLGLTTSEVGFVYNTVGVTSLLLGGIVGGYLISRRGLKFWLWPMAFAINIPDALYVYLATVQPSDLLMVNAAVAVEQFGYGFGFTAYMVYLMYVARGKHKTAHYAICTGLMALGVMVSGMFSGWLQERLGYVDFFWWVVMATVPSFVVTAFVRVDADYGKKSDV